MGDLALISTQCTVPFVSKMRRYVNLKSVEIGGPMSKLGSLDGTEYLKRRDL